MRLDRILQAMLPHDQHFFDMFEEAAQNITLASEALTGLLSATSEEERRKIVAEIQDYEHQGDAITHKIFSALSSTFVTPFDPEDIHLLASAMDDILDNIDGSARRFLLYKLEGCPQDMFFLVQSLQRSVAELQRGLHFLRKMQKTTEMKEIIRRINDYEGEADDIFAHAVADLFDKYADNPVQIIKLKEVYVSLETATDMCEDAADVLETILIKHA
jgi:predicted phosphate transport protein (TIGR00153 family)